jgi:hypothetical protein
MNRGTLLPRQIIEDLARNEAEPTLLSTLDSNAQPSSVRIPVKVIAAVTFIIVKRHVCEIHHRKAWRNMAAKKHHFFPTVLFIIVICVNLLSVQGVLADGEPPTEPPAPTQVATEPPIEPTSEAVEATPIPMEPTASPVVEILTQVPDDTGVVVLDENGNSIPLASQEAADLVEVNDPIWCPAGVLPGGAGCSSSYPAISDLINNMISNTSAYTQNGVIYFTATAGSSLTLTDAASPSSLGTSAFNTLNDFNLTLQGGWNGVSGAGASFSGQTNFASNSITIGTLSNPWVGNITLKDLKFSTVTTANAVSIFTTSGNITLSNVDVAQQSGGNFTAFLNSNSGNISVQNGSTFDGSASSGTTDESQGFLATTGSGSIAIADTLFKDSRKTNPGAYNGATLSAPTVTLTNVTAVQNDGNGIAISNAGLVTLNNVISGSDLNGQGNGLSGVLINGTGSTIVQVVGGTFADNHRYGIEIYGGSLIIQASPACPTSGTTSNTLGCYNVTPITDSTTPVITPTITGLAGSNGWYRSDVSVSWSSSDAESSIVSSSGCATTQLTSETTGTTLTCSATNGASLSNSASVEIKIDKTAPVLDLPLDIHANAMSASGAVIFYSALVTDNLDSSVSVSCSPVSGSTFDVGTTTVNCSSTDAAGNLASGHFQVAVQDTTPPTLTSTPTSPVNTPVPTDTSTPPSSGVDRPQSPSTTSASVMPNTGAQLIDLDCNSVFWAFGIKLTFYNLCDQQTTLHYMGAKELPAPLPAGVSYLIGLNVDILTNGQTLQNLPDGSGIQIDFPLNNQPSDQVAVLYWNDPDEDGTGEWIEVLKPLSQDKVVEAFTTKSTDEFYKLITSATDTFYPSLTTDKTGVFILVKK